MIIEKKVCDLKPGDILPEILGAPMLRVVLATRTERHGSCPLLVAILGPDHDGLTRLTEHMWHPESAVKVEVPDLTPAQQHADELLDLVRDLPGVPEYGARARDLLNKIDPPQPPTLEEAIQVLVDVYAKSEDARSVTAISALLDRARSHGLL